MSQVESSFFYAYVCCIILPLLYVLTLLFIYPCGLYFYLYAFCDLKSTSNVILYYSIFCFRKIQHAIVFSYFQNEKVNAFGHIYYLKPTSKYMYIPVMWTLVSLVLIFSSPCCTINTLFTLLQLKSLKWSNFIYG